MSSTAGTGLCYVAPWLCPHCWRELRRYPVWTCGGSENDAPAGVPVTVVYECTWCGEVSEGYELARRPDLGSSGAGW